MGRGGKAQVKYIYSPHTNFATFLRLFPLTNIFLQYFHPFSYFSKLLCGKGIMLCVHPCDTLSNSTYGVKVAQQPPNLSVRVQFLVGVPYGYNSRNDI